MKQACRCCLWQAPVYWPHLTFCFPIKCQWSVGDFLDRDRLVLLGKMFTLGPLGLTLGTAVLNSHDPSICLHRTESPHTNRCIHKTSFDNNVFLCFNGKPDFFHQKTTFVALKSPIYSKRRISTQFLVFTYCTVLTLTYTKHTTHKTSSPRGHKKGWGAWKTRNG